MATCNTLTAVVLLKKFLWIGRVQKDEKNIEWERVPWYVVALL